MMGMRNKTTMGHQAALKAGVAVLAGVALLLAGCSAKHYRESADKEAYAIIKSKSPAVTNLESNFTIETNAVITMDDLPTVSQIDAFLGEYATNDVGSRVLPLNRALEIAVKNSRTYQTQKETLYLEALNLTLIRHKYTPIFSSGNAAKLSGQKEIVEQNIDQLTESPKFSGSGNVGMDVLLRSGARIATDFSSDFTHFILGGNQNAGQSRIAATLTQPLLRNAGYKATMENLTQGERNLLYALRDFSQFRRRHIVDITSAYFRVLANRETARINYDGFQAYKKNAARQRAFVDVDQRKKSDLLRLEQEQISQLNRWVNSVRSYKQSMDSFKIQLGLPADARLVLDDAELKRLTIIHPKVSIEDATRVALINRLDLYTQRDKYEDAARKIDLAKQGLKADLDLVLQASADSKPGTGFPELDFTKVQWSSGFNLNLPLDRKSERNTYRQSLITYQRALRDLELKADSIKLEVSDSWRQLDQYQQNYRNSEIGLEISRQRVYEQDMLAEIGRGNSEEQVNAQQNNIAALSARNDALVSHTIGRLTLWRDLGILNIKENGQWEEITDVVKQ